MLWQPKNPCPHCDPCPTDGSHFFERLENWSFSFTEILNPAERLLRKFPKIHLIFNKVILVSFFKLFLKLKILRETEATDTDEQLHNRTLVVVREAKKRGIEIRTVKFLNRNINHFSIKINGVKKFFEGLPHLAIESIRPVDFDDKGILKNILRKNNLPHPQGCVFNNFPTAQYYVKNTIGFPVVVKPKSGSLSKHTSCDIKDDEELKRAVKISQMINREFVVEEFIKGGVYRITVIDGEVVAACLREPPNVTGDGQHTINELIEIKNQNPNRGFSHQKNFTLHRIAISEKTHQLLKSQNLTIESVPPYGEKIYLHNKVILAGGADIHDTTDQIHPENKILFKKVQESCAAPVVGIDFIAVDISQPYQKQKCAIIEANSLPFIDMHHYPVTGKEQDVAGRLLDFCLAP